MDFAASDNSPLPSPSAAVHPSSSSNSKSASPPSSSAKVDRPPPFPVTFSAGGPNPPWWHRILPALDTIAKLDHALTRVDGMRQDTLVKVDEMRRDSLAYKLKTGSGMVILKREE